MAESQKPQPVQKPSRLSDSVNYKIGGKEYRPGAASTVQNQTRIPRPIPGASAKIPEYPQGGGNTRPYAVRLGATENVTFGSTLQNETYQRTAGYTQGVREAEHMFRVAENVRSGELYQEIAEGKALAGRFASGTESTKEYIRGLGFVAKSTVSTEYADAVKAWKAAPKKGGLLTDGKVMLGKAASSLSSEDDLGSHSVGGVVATAGVTNATLKVTRGAIKVGVPAAKKTAVGVYNLSDAIARGAITVGRTVKTAVSKNQVFFSKETFESLKANATSSGFLDTKVVKGIEKKAASVVEGAQKVGDGLKKTGSGIASGARVVKTAVNKGVDVARGVTNGTLKFNISKEQMEAFRTRAFQGIKTGLKKGVKTAAGVAVRGTAKGVSVAVFNGVPKAGKVLNKGTTAGAGIMMASEDSSVQALGYAATGTKMAAKVGKVGTKMTVKTAAKVGKTTGYTVKTSVKAARYINKNGWKAGWEKGWKKLGAKFKNAISQAGKSIISAMLKVLKALGSKVAVPFLVVAVIVAVVAGAVAGPMAAFGTLFGGVFNTDEDGKISEHEIREFLMDPSFGIPALAGSYQQSLAEQMKDSAEDYNIVRFYSNTRGDDPVEATVEGIAEACLPNEQIANMLQPMFNAVVLMEYELTPTESQAKSLVREMFNGLFRVETEESLEYCGQAISTGEGTVTQHDCGYIHAESDCPNYVAHYHMDYTCASCCRYVYTCNGHKGSLNCTTVATSHSHTEWVSQREPGCYSTVKHDGEMQYDCGNSSMRLRCSGYKYCLGHTVISYKLTLDGAYALESQYFREPINRLSNIPAGDRTEEEKNKLEDLKTYYEVYRELTTLVAQQHGGGLTMSDLSNVNFVQGTRKGNQAVVDLALSQVGQTGGQPYWSYYGFGSRVEWCGCFVHWCMRNTPSATDAYPTTANNAYCPTIANHFQSIGQWGNRNFTNLVPGDVILFDWEGDGEADHVGIVIGQDGTYVYTVEGNAGDAVIMTQYLIGSSAICGYGLLNY